MSDPHHSETVGIGPVHVGRHVGPHAPMTGRWVCADDCPHPDHSAEQEALREAVASVVASTFHHSLLLGPEGVVQYTPNTLRLAAKIIAGLGLEEIGWCDDPEWTDRTKAIGRLWHKSKPRFDAVPVYRLRAAESGSSEADR